MTATASKPTSKRNVFISDVVTLDGYQAIMKPSKFGYTLSCLVPQDLIDRLEADREEVLKWCQSKVKNVRRAVCKPEPWVEVEPGLYRLKFSWNDETLPNVVDSEGTLIDDENLPLYSGSLVKVAFRHKGYVMKDDTYGTCVKLVGVQVVSCQNANGFDSGELTQEDVATLFGKTKGYVLSQPNVVPIDSSDPEEDDDF